MDSREDTVTGGRMVTRELAEWVAGLRFEDLPSEVVEEAARAFTDFLGESLFVGATKPWGQSIAAFCAQDGGGQPEATILASGRKTLTSRAAMANGTMALGFEYADFGASSRAYPFAVTGPLALAESRHKPGQGPRPRHRHRLRGPGQDLAGDAPARLRTARSGFYVPALYGTFGCAGRLRPGARALAVPHQLSRWVSPPPSPAAPSRVTRRAPGSGRSTAAWPASGA